MDETDGFVFFFARLILLHITVGTIDNQTNVPPDHSIIINPNFTVMYI